MRLSFVSAWWPKSVLCLVEGYDRRTFLSDAVAGVTVGLVALPLGMAFAIASGLPPQSGIYCAIVTGFLISLLGGSRCQIGGPTGAFVVVVAGIVATHGVEGLFMCTMMAGVILVVLGLTGMGQVVRFIPRPVVVGFTNGIAILIASTQIRDFLGLRMETNPGEFLERVRALLDAAPTWSPIATALSAFAVVAILVVRRIAPRISGTVLVLMVATVLVAWAGIPVETVGSRFGGIPSGLPVVHVPGFRADLLLSLLSPALTIAMLGAIESLLSAVVADRMSGDRHNPNVELVAQGVANIASPLFGGLPATGAIARTATNIRTGGRTPVAGMIHAGTLLSVLLVAAPLARYIPLPVLAGILIVVSYTMGEWHEIPEIWKLTKAEIVVWFATLALTVLADLTVAVEAGMILAVLLFIRNVTSTTTVARVTEGDVKEGYAHILQDKDIPPHVTIFRIQGPFLFGATDKVREIEERIDTLPAVVILRMRHMTALDATGLLALEELAARLREGGRTLIVCGAPPQPARVMRQSGFDRHVGSENVCDSVVTALERARQIRGEH